jgi:predicted nucleic acid-binding protein
VVLQASQVQKLREQLHPDEAEAIALALELNADVVLLDEMRGRDVAKGLGLQHTGLLGVLIQAKKQGLFSQVVPILDQLRHQMGFWVSASLYRRVRSLAGE